MCRSFSLSEGWCWYCRKEIIRKCFPTHGNHKWNYKRSRNFLYWTGHKNTSMRLFRHCGTVMAPVILSLQVKLNVPGVFWNWNGQNLLKTQLPWPQVLPLALLWLLRSTLFGKHKSAPYEIISGHPMPLTVEPHAHPTSVSSAMTQYCNALI